MAGDRQPLLGMPKLESVSDEKFAEIYTECQEYQVVKGSLLVRRGDLDAMSPIAGARPVGVSIIPTPFPDTHFSCALEMQEAFNELYIRVTEDDAWLESVINGLKKSDEFATKLWDIWERVRDEGEVQPLRCGVFRSDYMLHRPPANGPEDLVLQEDEDAYQSVHHSQLKQVEFNTYSCSGASHANVVANMHRHLARKRVYGIDEVQPSLLPLNHNIAFVAGALAAAHCAYGPPISRARQAAILMTVQPDNFNICDERPIEYELAEFDPPVVLYRVDFSDDILRKCTLGPNRELLLEPSAGQAVVEISVVYQRAGYQPHEYDPKGIEARLMLERSRAIKCPTILAHMAGFKKVQQELAKPNMLQRFLSPEKADLLQATFMPMYPLDDTPDGLRARQLALDEETAEGYVLKPSLDGGGNNVYGHDIPAFLKSAVPRNHWQKYVLMEKIRPPPVQGIVAFAYSAHRGPVISELGVLGTCLWRRDDRDGDPVILQNDTSGSTFKTKPYDVDEMNVVKGYGCFDCPLLVPRSTRSP
ncbi:glutathione synthase [Xylariomycetidae sp. FL0641]|nr:glutathione synthase [Xylariomycetidae sp. FL0641]